MIPVTSILKVVPFLASVTRMVPILSPTPALRELIDVDHTFLSNSDRGNECSQRRGAESRLDQSLHGVLHLNRVPGKPQRALQARALCMKNAPQAQLVPVPSRQQAKAEGLPPAGDRPAGSFMPGIVDARPSRSYRNLDVQSLFPHTQRG